MFNELLNSAKAEYGVLTRCYRHLHKFPEKGLSLPRTTSFVKEDLAKAGIQSEDCGGGIIAFIGKGEPCILLRADMDALELKEETGLDFASENGCMHACGHDMHTTMLLGAARLLKARESTLSGRIALCFQPGEETLSGAMRMIDCGLIERTGADAAVMLHVLSASHLPSGTVIIPPSGVGAAGADFFRADVFGKGCHGSTPHLGRDPIFAAAQMISALASLTCREAESKDGCILTVGIIRGGESANVIPDRLSLFGTLRSYSDDSRAFMKDRLVEICSDTARACRCSSAVEFTSSAPSFINNERIRSLAISALDSAPLPPYIVPEGQRGGGSEDFAYVSRLIPSLMLCLSAGEASKGYTRPLHSPEVRFDEGALPYGAAAYAAVAMELAAQLY